MNIKNHIKQNGILLLIGLLILIFLVILGVRNSDLGAQAIPVCGDGSVNTGEEECDDGNLTNGDGCSSECLLINQLSIDDQTVQAANDPFVTNISFETSGDQKICGLKFNVFFLNTLEIDEDMIKVDNNFPWSITFVDYEKAEEGGNCTVDEDCDAGFSCLNNICESQNDSDILSFEAYQFFDEDAEDPLENPLKDKIYTIGTIEVNGGYTDNFLFKLADVEITECSGPPEYFNVGKSREDVQNNTDNNDDFILDDGLITVQAADTTPPVIVPPNTPADDDTDVSINTNFVITFNEPVVPGAGTLTLYKQGNPIASSPATSLNSNDSLTFSFTPPNPLEPNTNYYILIQPSAFADLSNNSFLGIQTATGWDFTTD